ncbi:MAG: hypothetical protein GF398_00885 [Chitinivibrionales bacterium]|nr:hypothetical protein [Chitinivibrionales bacterium]
MLKNAKSKGEAHLYVAVAKADGIISHIEKVRAPYYAEKSQKMLDMMNANQRTRDSIRNELQGIFASQEHAVWSADEHLDEAIRLLNIAKDQGDWTVKLSGTKNEAGLQQLALLDGYLVKESRFLTKIHEQLKVLA